MISENTHKLMGFYMEGLILGVSTMYRLFCFFKLFLIGLRVHGEKINKKALQVDGILFSYYYYYLGITYNNVLNSTT